MVAFSLFPFYSMNSITAWGVSFCFYGGQFQFLTFSLAIYSRSYLRIHLPASFVSISRASFALSSFWCHHGKALGRRVTHSIEKAASIIIQSNPIQ